MQVFLICAENLFVCMLHIHIYVTVWLRLLGIVFNCTSVTYFMKYCCNLVNYFLCLY